MGGAGEGIPRSESRGAAMNILARMGQVPTCKHLQCTMYTGVASTVTETPRHADVAPAYKNSFSLCY